VSKRDRIARYRARSKPAAAALKRARTVATRFASWVTSFDEPLQQLPERLAFSHFSSEDVSVMRSAFQEFGQYSQRNGDAKRSGPVTLIPIAPVATPRPSRIVATRATSPRFRK
jgi:hypothetical protein